MDRWPPPEWPDVPTDSQIAMDAATITAIASAVATVLTAAAVLVRAWRDQEPEESH